ncbi:MAG: bifunctional aspartate kinase/diaminopimelate decarboxylase [Xanthomonadales bacterium]|nr:bifunctional aspartate kinase/diaminopimelate decarboxylase [Xanthomonadales bacterium]
MTDPARPLPPDAPWIVLKFGGSSVGRAECWPTIAGLARERLGEGARVMLVVSALAGATDALKAIAEEADVDVRRQRAAELAQRHIDFANQLGVDPGLLSPWLARLAELAVAVGATGECSGPWARQAELMALGELMSSTLGNAALRKAGLASRWLDARDCLLAQPVANQVGWAHWLSASVPVGRDDALRERLAGRAAAVFITQGFIARNADGCTVLLGRGGSDTSAAYFGASLDASRVEIWSDVAGLFSANPREVPGARLLRRLDFEEAQEIATTGAKMLHPRCLSPLRRTGVPLWIRDTGHPELDGTRIGPEVPDAPPSIKAVSSRRGVTLVSMETVGMWQQVGFLADVFQVFRKHGLSVDLIGSAETNVTVSLDPSDNLVDSDVLAALCAELAGFCRVRAITPCTAITFVGRGMRGLLYRLRDVLAEIGSLRVHLISQSSNDLNLTFVLDEVDAEGLLPRLHDALIASGALPAEDDAVFGPSWAQLYAGAGVLRARPWWRDRAPALQALATEATPMYVYDLATVRAKARALAALPSVARWHYAVKANPHADVLRVLAAEGFDFECVSPGELDAVQAALPILPAERLLFTPNMATAGEYRDALARGARIGIDGLEPLRALAGGAFDAGIALRLDLGPGRGLHAHVRTGQDSKFGLPLADLPEALAAAAAAGLRVEVLHAHLGSGILDAGHWRAVGLQLASLADRLPDVAALNLGGGLGVPYQPGQPSLDLAALDAALAELRRAYPHLALWMEPGRYLVAEAGVLLTRVRQVKRKGERLFVGVDAGMHTLLRPALYDAWHPVENLDRPDGLPDLRVDVVGPICESADTLAAGRLLARGTASGDLLLFDLAGAYGAVMASDYNLRGRPRECVLDAAEAVP